MHLVSSSVDQQLHPLANSVDKQLYAPGLNT